MNETPSCVIEDHWIETDGGRMLARCWRPGNGHGGTPIVLFHDSLGAIELWRGFPQALATRTGRPVIAYDRLGYGRSDALTAPPPASFIADEATQFFPQLLRQLGLDRVIAFGHSVGGGMAVHCAALLGPVCAGLITESAQAFVEDRTLAGIVEAKAQFQQDDAFARLVRYHGDKARWVLDAWTETWLSPDFAQWSLQDVLPGVACPLLALHGAQDEYGSNAHPEMIAELAAGPARAEIMPDTRHVPHREREALVLDHVAAFLAEHAL